MISLVPLGGLGEIGRNLMAIECGEDIVVVDCGLMFPEQEMLGIDLVIPDITWLHGARAAGARHRAHPRARGPHRRSALRASAAARARSTGRA